MNKFYAMIGTTFATPLPLYVALTLAMNLANAQSPNAVGTDPTSDTLLPTGRLIAPAGDLLPLYGRPVDLEVGRFLFVKDWKSLRVVDREAFEILQTIEAPGGASLFGLAVTKDDRVLFTSADQRLHVYGRKPKDGTSEDGKNEYELQSTIEFPKGSFPCGVTVSSDGRVFVCLSKRNSLGIVDLEQGKLVEERPVGVAPFDVVVSEPTNRLFVSNIGGRHAKEDDATAPSADTETVVDARGIASTGTISVLKLDSLELESTLSTDLHPSVMLTEADKVWVCNTNADCVTQLGPLLAVMQKVITKPEQALPFGSMPNAIAISPDKRRLFVALAGNNAIAVFELNDGKSQLQGLVPTAWFPSGLDCDDDYLYIANTKGLGARSERRAVADGMNSHDHRGLIQRIPLADIFDGNQLDAWTTSVKSNSRVLQALKATSGQVTDDQAEPSPVPNRLGEPSVFKHVIYVIKENRTFDQVFGDIKEARSEPALCVFPEEVTPNHHALAKRFGVLDNYYCNGVLSADGHSWATEGNVTPYLERAFGGFARSYTFGDDPITYSSSGFVWDRVLAAGLSFRNYGEMDYATPPEGMKYQEIWKAYQAGEAIQFEQNIGIERLQRYSCRNYPGWNMLIPDTLRIDRFLAEFRKFEQYGGLPNLCIVYLPQDHLGGGVTSRAHMADNDLALGRLVEAVSQSKYWSDTVIFVNEDDPQNGYDHIDGHRSVCLVISPYSRPGVNHDFFNQTSVLRTILHILGLSPLNQQDASAPLMASCFQSTPENQAPYEAKPANFPLNEQPKPKDEQTSTERHWRSILATVPIERTGMKSESDEDNLNRFVWHEMMGWQREYPRQWTGAHGRGLAQLGLEHQNANLMPARDEELAR